MKLLLTTIPVELRVIEFEDSSCLRFLVRRECCIPGFDAVMCLGNSFSHLPDVQKNGQTHVNAIQNFWEMVKPGGYLVIDHRNYDYILDHGKTPAKSIYYNVRISHLVHSQDP